MLQRTELIEGDIIIHHLNEIKYYTFRYKGNDYLIVFNNFTNSILKGYRHIIKKQSDPEIENSGLLDISGFKWLMHPLTAPNLVKRLTREKVYESWKVQPGLSFSDYDEDSEVSKLLSVVQTFLKETWNAELKVIASE